MINKKECYKLKAQFIFLYDDENVYIYNYIEEKVVLKIKISNNVKDAIKKIDGVIPLSEVVESLDDKDEKIVLMIIGKYLDVFFQSCNYAEKEEAINEYIVRKFIQNNMGSFKKTAVEMIDIVKESIKKSRIVLIGCGILGCEVLSNILEMGIRNVLLIDDKKVNVCDNRWSIFTNGSELGEDRKLVVKNSILKKYKNLEVHMLDNIKQISEHCNKNERDSLYCIVCEDELIAERNIYYNEQFNKKNLKWTSIYVDSEKISIGPTIIPKITGCLNCKAGKYELPSYNGFSTISPQTFKLAASIFSNDLYNNLHNNEEYLIKDISVTLGKQFVLNLSGLNGYTNELLIDPNCNCRKK